jgi:hypothetical protein
MLSEIDKKLFIIEFPCLKFGYSESDTDLANPNDDFILYFYLLTKIYSSFMDAFLTVAM